MLKQVVPPILVDLARGRHTGPIWDGLYAHRRDVPVRAGTFDHAARIREMTVQAEGLLAEVRAGRKPAMWHDLLVSTAAVVAAEMGSVTVVDFGGGPGTGFIQLQATLPKTARIHYHVVELEGMCVAGRAVFHGDDRIVFHTALDNVPCSPDIVYVNSVLQYIDDYAGQLQLLAALQARWIILSRMAAGDIPTYATSQLNVRDQVLAYWFLNQNEVVTILRAEGYALAFDALGSREYDQRNFPESHRVGRMREMIFAGLSTRR
jgi:putative methyltransferase (TIGR04325 family)